MSLPSEKLLIVSMVGGLWSQKFPAKEIGPLGTPPIFTSAPPTPVAEELHRNTLLPGSLGVPRSAGSEAFVETSKYTPMSFPTN
jgi:hypothetical protein